MATLPTAQSSHLKNTYLSHFLFQYKAECLFLNGTQRVRYLERYFYDRQEFVRFDSDLGKHVAVTPLGEADAEKWNNDKRWMQEQKATVDFFCRQSYETGSYEAPKREERAIGRRAHFLYQVKHECLFLNGTQQVRFLFRDFYDRQEVVRFDSDLGKFVAVTELGKVDADDFNSDKQALQYYKASVDRFCRQNYERGSYEATKREERMIGRRAKPTVTISPTKMDSTSPNTILLCIATGFYPLEIEVQWLKNGQLEEEDVAFGEELQNGDWTYQLQVMLETLPHREDIYTCKVGHVSLEAPITVQWEPRSSSSARSKLWTGIMGAVIGAVFLAVGLFSYLKSKKAIPIQPPAALMD